MRQRVNQSSFDAADSVGVTLKRKIFFAGGAIAQNAVVEFLVAIKPLKIFHIVKDIGHTTGAFGHLFLQVFFFRFGVVMINNNFVDKNRLAVISRRNIPAVRVDGRFLVEIKCIVRIKGIADKSRIGNGFSVKISAYTVETVPIALGATSEPFQHAARIIGGLKPVGAEALPVDAQRRRIRVAR